MKHLWNIYFPNSKKLLSDATGKTLEVGIGTGKNIPFYPDDVILTGIDFSPKMVEITKTKIKTGGIIMKTTLIAILIMLSGTLAANAQMDKQDKQKSNEKKGMMMKQEKKEMTGMPDRMMQNRKMMPMGRNMMMQDMPMQRYMMMVQMLPKMQDKLSLSAKQTKELIEMRSTFEKNQVDMKAKMAEKQDQLQELLKNEASASEVKAQLQECAESKIEMHVAAYETSMQMRKILNEEQKEKACKMMDDDDSRGMMNQ